MNLGHYRVTEEEYELICRIRENAAKGMISIVSRDGAGHFHVEAYKRAEV